MRINSPHTLQINEVALTGTSTAYDKTGAPTATIKLTFRTTGDEIGRLIDMATMRNLYLLIQPQLNFLASTEIGPVPEDSNEKEEES